MSKESSHDVTTDAADGEQGNKTKSNNDSGKDTVAYESYDKVMKQLKAKEAAYKALESKLAEQESASLEAQGKFKDLYERATKELTKEKTKSADLIRDFGRSNLESALKLKLASEGCIDSDLALKALDYSDCKFGDDFSIDQAFVDTKTSGLLKDKPHLFKKAAIETSDLDPTSNISINPVSQMTAEQTLQAYKAAGGK